MNIEELKKIVASAPKTPGVYTWRSASNHILYIGKANDIRARLNSYLKAKDPRILVMRQEAQAITWETVGTEIEALILESRLISQRKPKFNIVMRDDKQYAYVAFTDEQFPQPIVTHQAKSPRIKKPIKRLIGPFTDSGALTTTLRWLRGLFPYCTCKQKHHVKCLNAHMGKCPGYCCLKTPRLDSSSPARQAATQKQIAEYRATVRALMDILEGKRDGLVARLERDMKKLGADHRLDEALALKNRIERIRRVFENAQLVASRRKLSARHPGALAQLTENLGLAKPPLRIEGYDIAHIQGAHASGAMVVFTDGNPDTAQYRLFNLHDTSIGDTAQLREVLERRLNHDEWPLPDLILVDGGKAQLNTMIRVLDGRDHHIPVIALTKDDRHQADHLLSSLDAQVRMLTDIPRPMRALVTHIDEEAHRFSIGQYRRRHQKTLRK